MIEFSKQVAEKWNISTEISDQICKAFERGDTPFYLSEYSPKVAAELTSVTVGEIYDFLNSVEELSSKKKRILNALKKMGTPPSDLERRVQLTTNPFELDDILIPLRPNPRSKGQTAIKKGLEPLADVVEKQEEETTSLEELAEPYVGKDSSLKSVDDVIQGVKDILAERFSYDETVRAMVREFAYEDGFFEVLPKNKKSSQYSAYIDKLISIHELPKDEVLALIKAEEQKKVRLKLGVQLFRIIELLRHHFIENPDSIGFDLICESIDDGWQRLLQPMVERDIKTRLQQDALEWAIHILVTDIDKKYTEELDRGSVLFVDAGPKKNILLLAVNGQGNLLGTTSEKKHSEKKSTSGDRLQQFFFRHKPSTIVIYDNDQADAAEEIVARVKQSVGFDIPTIRFAPGSSRKNPVQSPWMTAQFSNLLTPQLQNLYGIALLYLQPISLVNIIGLEYFSVHPFQNLIPGDVFSAWIERIIVEKALRKGVTLKDGTDSALDRWDFIPKDLLWEMRTTDTKQPFTAKNDVLKVPQMSEALFRNLAGFLIIPTGIDPLDRTTVHPDHFPVIMEMCEQLNVSSTTLVNDPGLLRSYAIDDAMLKIFIEKKLIPQLQVGQRFAGMAATPSKPKRKLKLSELKEGAIVSGRVTNITQFGVFVNINAVCDGLIHISQLADEYVESPDQVVSVNDTVDVRILKVDVKKRRISLSMKNLGQKAPKVRPSQGQLSTLAEHFKNR